MESDKGSEQDCERKAIESSCRKSGDSLNEWGKKFGSMEHILAFIVLLVGVCVAIFRWLIASSPQPAPVIIIPKPSPHPLPIMSLPSGHVRPTPIQKTSPPCLEDEKTSPPCLEDEGYLIVNKMYFPTGYMGDIGDLSDSGYGKWIYQPTGQGPHKFEWEYIDFGKKKNPDPAKFAGVAWLAPANNWGTDSTGGFDLSGVKWKEVRWKARSPEGEATVEFFLGGVTHHWEDKGDHCEWVKAPYPDTLPKLLLDKATLTNEWEEFVAPIDNVSSDQLTRVVCPFGWVMTWGDNNVNPQTEEKTENTKQLTIEVKDIIYIPQETKP